MNIKITKGIGTIFASRIRSFTYRIRRGQDNVYVECERPLDEEQRKLLEELGGERRGLTGFIVEFDEVTIGITTS